MDEFQESGYVQHPCAGNWMARLALAQIDDAVKLLRRGYRGKIDICSRPAQSSGSFRLQEVNDFWDTVWWMWMERDDDAEREFSLDWCCMVLQQFGGSSLEADCIRQAAERAGFKPARPREKLGVLPQEGI